ncbi:hypothetical protein BDB00DRAFT_814644 [Zychaea mexicana]|uniref:uncharacterized protein n=1 Tax=Zychaea mexicana TaxID=64656 RepID=UPI0022FE19FA|nr:uncharacterized protein BDB00DRAFT_814644 [Zychaea mexicana]KAI9495428.1 hypothetical protein BDB00DRAFT_814644 [Zychaea mexicana]
MQNSWRGQSNGSAAQRSPPPFDGETVNSEPLQFGSEPSLTKVSLFGGDSSFNMISDELSFHPSSSPLPLDIVPTETAGLDDDDDDEEQERTPLPNDNNNRHQQQQQLLLQQQQERLEAQVAAAAAAITPLEHQHQQQQNLGLLNDHSSLFDQESRLEHQFELLSMADANGYSESNINDAVAASSKQLRNDHASGYHGPVVNGTNNNESQKERSTTLTLKEQEKTIDTLKKENFGLKLKIYFLEKRLDDISPDQVDNALKENVDLKVSNKTLTQELKKYTKMIWELESAMDILQRNQKACDLPHGMSSDEQMEYETALTNAAQSQEENKRLHKMVAELNAENAKLRVRSSASSPRHASPIRISRSNSNGSRHADTGYNNNNDDDDSSDYWISHHQRRPQPNNNNNNNNKDQVEMYRKEWLQAKQTIERQNQTIQLLREENEMHQSATTSSASGKGRNQTRYTSNDSLVRSILSDRDAYVSKAEHLQDNLSRMQERNSEVMAQLLNKNKELDRMHEHTDELVRSLHDAKQMLRGKTNECQKLREELEDALQNRHNSRTKNVTELLETLDGLRQENSDRAKLVEKLRAELEDSDYVHRNQVAKLDAEIERREQEFMALEAQVVKVMNRAEKLEARDKEKDKLIKELERRIHEQSTANNNNNNNYNDNDDNDNDENYDVDEDIERLEEELRLKDEQIAKYEQQLEEVDAHNETDLNALEDRFMQVEQTMQHKDDQIKELEEELESMLQKTQEAKNRYEEDLQMLERQFQELEQAMRERDVRIASLEGHLEAQTDAVQREKGLHKEEIKELEDKLRAMANLLREKDMLMANMETQMEHRAAGARDAAQAYESDLQDIKEQLGSRMIEAEEEWEVKVTDLTDRLKATEDQLKKDRRLANEKLTEAVSAKRTLQQKLESANKKNGLLNDLLDQYQRSSESKYGSRSSTMSSSQAQMALTKLNQELQREIEERDRALQHESARLQECELDCGRLAEELEQVEQEKDQLNELLTRRNSMITRLFERLESTNERKAVMESVLLRQATDEVIDNTSSGSSGHGSLHNHHNRRADSAMSSR